MTQKSKIVFQVVTQHEIVRVSKLTTKDTDGCTLICWHYIFIVNVKIIVYRPRERYKLRAAEIDSSDPLRPFFVIKENRLFIRILLLWAKRCNFECAKQTKELGSNTFFPDSNYMYWLCLSEKTRKIFV